MKNHQNKTEIKDQRKTIYFSLNLPTNRLPPRVLGKCCRKKLQLIFYKDPTVKFQLEVPLKQSNETGTSNFFENEPRVLGKQANNFNLTKGCQEVCVLKAASWFNHHLR